MFEGAEHSENTTHKSSPPGLSLESRRSFLGGLLGLGLFLVGALLSVPPLIRFALFPLLRRTTDLKESPVGALTEFSSLTEPVMRTIQIEQVDGWRKAISEKAVYVTKDSQRLRVLTSICPHLGCTVPWNKEKNQFACPCHGATFAADGTRVSGPSLRGMDTLETSAQDGQLLVRFQYFRQLVSDKEVIG